MGVILDQRDPAHTSFSHSFQLAKMARSLMLTVAVVAAVVTASRVFVPAPAVQKPTPAHAAPALPTAALTSMALVTPTAAHAAGRCLDPSSLRRRRRLRHWLGRYRL